MGFKTKCIFGFILSIFFLTDLSAQSVHNRTKLSIIVSPNFSHRTLVPGSADPVCSTCPLTYRKLTDSISADKGRTTIGIGLQVTFPLSRFTELQTGIMYRDFGFQRTLKDRKFNDIIYPGHGAIYDLTNTQKDLNYQYRFKYIHVPVHINYRINRRRLGADARFYFSGGVGLNYLVKHDLLIKFEGFAYGDQDSEKADSTGFDANKFTMNAAVGFKGEYEFYKRFMFTIHPMAGYYFLPATKSPLQTNPYFLSIQAGFSYALTTDKKKD